MLTDDDRRCPDGPPTYPTPNGSKFPTPTVQNSPADRGRTAAAIGPSTGLVTDLLGCDGFATPEGNPTKTGSFIGLRLIGRYLSVPRRPTEPGRDAPPPSPGCRTPPCCTSAAREPCSHPGTIACRSAPRICAPA